MLYPCIDWLKLYIVSDLLSGVSVGKKDEIKLLVSVISVVFFELCYMDKTKNTIVYKGT